MAQHVPVKRILLIQFRMIGDVLLTTPLLRALRQHYPQSHIAYVTEPSPARVLRDNPYLDEVLIRQPSAPWYEQLQFLHRVRRARFDLVIDVMGNPRSAILSRLSGAKQRIAFARFPRSLCYTTLVPRPSAPEYVVSRRLRLLAPLGIEATDVSLDLAYTPQDQNEVEQFLAHHNITPDDLLICFDPTHHVLTRQWPGEHFSRLADRLSDRLGARVVLLWGPGEKEQVQAIATACQSQPLLIPAWGLAPLAALLARADLFVGCDSTPLHIAVSQRTPTLSIHGSTGTRGWVPPKPQHRVVTAGLPCQPCGKAQCALPQTLACLRTLTPEAVFQAIQACAVHVPKLQHVLRQVPSVNDRGAAEGTNGDA